MAPWMATPGLPSMVAETDVDEDGVCGLGEPGSHCGTGGLGRKPAHTPVRAWTDGGTEVPMLVWETEALVCPESFHIVA